MDRDLLRVMNIARGVRRRCEKFADRPSNGYTFISGTLSGMCGTASLALQIAAARRNLVIELIGGKFWNGMYWESHCWNTFGKWLIDLTATQFSRNYLSQKKVVLVRVDDVYSELRRANWKGEHDRPYFFSSVYENGFRSFGGWTANNKPNPELIEEILS